MPRPALIPVPSRVLSTLLVRALLVATAGIAVMVLAPSHVSTSQSARGPKLKSKAEATAVLQRQAACFVPNLGQWEHDAHYVARIGPMTMFVEERGWTFTLVERTEENDDARAIAVRMTFEGASAPELAAESPLPGLHHYFLGNDPEKWRSDVPLYGAVRYRGIRPGLDVLARKQGGYFEYDLILEPGAELDEVEIAVEGIERIRLDADGVLVLETALGPVRMPPPLSWEEGPAGERRPVQCQYVLRGPDRFGFEAPRRRSGWTLVVDPGLVWSTFLGSTDLEGAEAVAVDARGGVTVAGWTHSAGFPTKLGAYTAHRGGMDAFVTRLSPSGSSVVWSTFLGGKAGDVVRAIALDAQGAVTVAGETWGSSKFPVTQGAFQTTYNGGTIDAFVARLSPSGSSLVYSTFLGGKLVDSAHALAIDAKGAATVAGMTTSADFPWTPNAYDTKHNGSFDAFVTRLSPSGSSVVWSTFLGDSSIDLARALALDANGVVTVAGETESARFPRTTGAFQTTHNGGFQDAFVTRLDPSKNGAAQLVYSTFLGGSASDVAWALAIDARGAATVAGGTWSANFPKTPSAFDTIHGGREDVFVARLAPSGSSVVWSTFLGETDVDRAYAVTVDANGVTTVAGETRSAKFPTTSGSVQTLHKGKRDAFVSRLDPSKSGAGQLVYSTFLGGSGSDIANALSVDASGVVTATGIADSGFPRTTGAHGGKSDAFVSRLDMGVHLYGDVHEVSLTAGGSQKFTVNAGKAHAGRSYWIFGSVTGTTPGVTLGSAVGPVNIPLNPDIWTDYTIALANTATLTNTKATLDGSGTAQASLNIPKVNLPSAIGLVFHHAYLVYDQNNNFYLASNPVPLRLVK